MPYFDIAAYKFGLTTMIIKPHITTDNFDISWITKETQCWVYYPQEEVGPIYVKAVIKGIVPLSFKAGNSKVMVMLENGSVHETKASCLEKRRHHSSIEKDLIELDIINGGQIMDQLQRRFLDKKIHTYMWNSLIIVNPFTKIGGMYDKTIMQHFANKIYNTSKSDCEPHIYDFICRILQAMQEQTKTQFISISGESGSGKTETNKQCLRIISYACEKRGKDYVQSQHRPKSRLIEERILNCDSIIECFGNAKTSKNHNSSRYGKLVTEKINYKIMEIVKCEIKAFFLEKSRLVHQFEGERNFHVFYQLLQFAEDSVKKHLGFCQAPHSVQNPMKPRDFDYLQGQSEILSEDREMWDKLESSFHLLGFPDQVILHVYQILAVILHMGNLKFDDYTLTDHDPCEISNDESLLLISQLLMISEKQLVQALIFNKKTLAGQLMFLPLTKKQCAEGRDSMCKALYQNLFFWIIDELTKKVNEQAKQQSNIRVIKMLDIYGFEVFNQNSFQQLNVNYTNQRIHQVYLNQVFKNEKAVLKSEGLENTISTLKFTDNIKIIQLLDISPKSIYNLLDESCTLNVRDEDYLNNVKKNCEGRECFPAENNITLKKCFIIKHTPGNIEYMVSGFRDKNKDFLREDLVQKLSTSKIPILTQRFTQLYQKIKSESNKRFAGTKMRKEVSSLISEMSMESDLHFVRCIKPNENKQALSFVERVCFNQIKYLGILDTVTMRKDFYHVRMSYSKFYETFGILEGEDCQPIQTIVRVQKGELSEDECKERVKHFMSNNFKEKGLEYLCGKTRIFMKMETNTVLETTLRARMFSTSNSSTVIKSLWRYRKNRARNLNYGVHVCKVQKAVRIYLREIKTIKKKLAVRVIEREWIKHSNQYFQRKKRQQIMNVQKYIRTIICKRSYNSNYEAIRKANDKISALIKSHKQAQVYQTVLWLRRLLNGPIYDRIWNNMQQNYCTRLQKYLHAFSTIRVHRKQLEQVHLKTKIRLLTKSQQIISKYLKAVYLSDRYQQHIKKVILVQKNLKMHFIRFKKQNLLHNTLVIQRYWRRYYYNKMENIDFTHQYFGHGQLEAHWKTCLFRNFNQGNAHHSGFEKVLEKFEKVRKQKMTLFYYLLDIQILCQDVSHDNWLDNYMFLAEEGLMKSNAVQCVDVTDTYTTAATINKLYSWGCISLREPKSQTKFLTSTVSNIQEHYFDQGKISKYSCAESCMSVELHNPSSKQTYGDPPHNQVTQQWNTLTEQYVTLNGMILTVSGTQFVKITIPERVNEVSCGMAHVVCRTVLKKVYAWGNNTQGQLGLGDFSSRPDIHTPILVPFFRKKRIAAMQVSASAYGSIVLDTNSKIYWFGTNGTIKFRCSPQQCILSNKSAFIGNTEKYSPVRIISRWSKTMSIIGITMTCYDTTVQKPISLRKKVIENLMIKWSEDFNLINPPYSQNIASHISERHMPLPCPISNLGAPAYNYSHNQPNGAFSSSKEQGLTNNEVRERIMSQIAQIEKTERQLMKTRGERLTGGMTDKEYHLQEYQNYFHSDSPESPIENPAAQHAHRHIIRKFTPQFRDKSFRRKNN